MNNTEKLVNILDKMTNTDIERFMLNADGKTFDISELVKMPVNPSMLTLYKLNVKNGKASAKSINLNLAYAMPMALAEEVRRYWYYINGVDVDEIARLIKSVDRRELSEEHAVLFDILCHRVDNARTIFDNAGASFNVGNVAKVIVKCMTGAKLQSYDENVRESAKAMFSELGNLYDIGVNEEDYLPNVKILRETVTTMMRAIWLEQDGVVEKYSFKCSHNLAGDIYRVFYKGRALDSKGNVARNTVDQSVVMSEIILACVEAMQAKRADYEARKAAEATAA